jgi:ABC-type multidrug transport system permease subunit
VVVYCVCSSIKGRPNRFRTGVGVVAYALGYLHEFLRLGLELSAVRILDFTVSACIVLIGIGALTYAMTLVRDAAIRTPRNSLEIVFSFGFLVTVICMIAYVEISSSYVE